MRTEESRIKNQESRWFLKTILILGFWLLALEASAQCAMCRAALQGEANVKKAEAVNNGIVYLMIIPYLLVGVIGYVIYRMYNSRKPKKSCS